jgi:hypothetical protein
MRGLALFTALSGCPERTFAMGREWRKFTLAIQLVLKQQSPAAGGVCTEP